MARPGAGVTTTALGFTLIELMIVIAIIAIIAAIAIPNLIEARKSANEAAAIGSLKALAAAQTIFLQRDMEGDDTQDYGTLAEISNVSFVDPILGSGTKQGYMFVVSDPVSVSTWSCTASPQVPGTTGDRYFYIDHTNLIRRSDTGPATSTSTAN